MSETKLQRIERGIRQELRTISTTREDYPSMDAEWEFFSKKIRDLNARLNDREGLIELGPPVESYGPSDDEARAAGYTSAAEVEEIRREMLGI